ncbi:phosphatase PAP2 family protein [Streptomyces antibioticus]|uniref:phosphatase PAP2 family protein n=1 Tax=Streptomyces antibioticus TaxID=1890 RepID=UPI00224DE1E9|nr:phosphatase PAP2 family protein [Streptomyces antibioticus]MCX5170482.1 phosphatase PAP2 family protein [Streptomyces antibioticus]
MGRALRETGLFRGITPRAILWATAAAVALGFLIALEFTARHYDIPGPITVQAREVIFPPKSGFLLYAGMALMMVVLPWRQRLTATAAAIGIDVVIAAVRWTADLGSTEGHFFGNGALWVLLAYGVIALTRRTGPERVLLLKGVGLGLLLVAGRKAGDTWLLITSKSRPIVLDQYMATADHALGNPSWLVGRLVTATGAIGFNILDIVYGQLAVAAVIVSLYQLRNVAAERRFPAHHLVRTFLVIGLLGPGIYMIYPVVGPIFAYGTGAAHWESVSLWTDPPATAHWAVADLWPNTPPPVGTPQHMPFDEITPRNCMPSLHTAWATAIYIHTRKAPRFLRHAGTFWLLATLAATLGFGWHYGVDLIAGVVFVLTIEAALRAQARGWDTSSTWLVTYGATTFATLLLSYRYLPTQMAHHPWLAGPLLLLAMTSVIYAYIRTTTTWTLDAPSPAKSEPQPELV